MTSRLLISIAAVIVLAVAAHADTPHGVDLTAIDKSVTPGDDFYAYANGSWIKRTAIPADQARWGSFNILNLEAQTRTRALIENAAKTGAPGSEARKVGDFYAGFMDEKAIEAKGIAPLKAQLTAIAAIADKKALARAIGESLRADVDPLNNTNFQTENLFGIWVAPGFTDSEHYTPYLLQGGLGIPSRDYYLGTSAKMKAVQAAYKTYVATALKLAGIADSDKKADAIFDLETKIAKAQESIVDSQDVVKANNVWRARRISPKKRRAWTGTSSSTARARQDRTALSSGSLRPSPACPSWSPMRRSTPGKPGSPSIASIISRRNCPRPLSMRALTSTARRCRARRKQQDRWKRGVNAHQRRAGRCGGQALRREIFPARSQGQGARRW